MTHVLLKKIKLERRRERAGAARKYITFKGGLLGEDLKVTRVNQEAEGVKMFQASASKYKVSEVWEHVKGWSDCSKVSKV